MATTVIGGMLAATSHCYLLDSRDLLRRRAFCGQSSAARTARRARRREQHRNWNDLVCSDKAPRRLARAEPLLGIGERRRRKYV